MKVHGSSRAMTVSGLVLSALMFSLRIGAQPPAAPPLLSPQAAYDQASAPVDIVHRSKANWSEIEKQSLDIAVDQAKGACLARTSATYTGDDLISYARLCDLGQQWPIVFTAATTYINSSDASKPQLDQAYAFEVLANLNMQKWKQASSTCFAMLRSVPYNQLTDGITTTTVHYLQFAYLPDALDLLTQRQPYILDLIRSAAPTSVPAQPGAQSAEESSVPLHTLFEHALDLAALQQYNNQPERAAAVVSDINLALPATLPSDEAIFIASARRQYSLLGTHFPELPGAVSLLSPTASHRVNLGSVTVFFLFPPWCAQCVRQAHEMAPALFRNADFNTHIYGLLADNPPPAQPPTPHAAPAAAHHTSAPATAHPSDPPESPEVKSAADQLRGTPTLVVSPSTLEDFHAIDFPFLIATDHAGIIRLMVSAAPENALIANGPVDQIIDTITQNWPASKPAAQPSAK